MRILSIILQYPPERRIGSELYDHELHKALTKAGHTIEVVATELPEKSWNYEGIEVNKKVEGEYDLILTHIDLRQKAWYIARLHDLTHLPIIGIQHNNAVSTVLAEKLYAWHGIIYNSENSKNIGASRTPNKTVLIPPLKAVGKTPVSAGDKVVQVNLNRIKGGDDFWKVATANPHIDFLAVEGGWGEQIIPYHVPSNVEYVENQEDMTEVWKRAGLLLVLSDPLEAWAMVAAEAGRHGVPTLTFNDIEGVMENIGDSGFIIPRSKSFELPSDYKPSKEIQQHYSKQATLHRKQLKETITFLEGWAR